MKDDERNNNLTDTEIEETEAESEIIEETINKDTEPDSLPEETPEVNNQTTPDTTALNNTNQPKSKKPLAIALMIALLFIGGIAFWMLSKNDTPEPITSNNQETTVMRFGVAVGLSEGTVEYSQDGTNWLKIDTNTEIEEGMYVRTAGDGRVVLLIDDGSAVRLDNNSSALIKSLESTNIIIENTSGEMYSRVTTSESRKYTVLVDETSYQAKGTAYRTSNTDTKKGVEVYQSIVAKEETDVTEGNAYYTLAVQKEKENVVSAIDLTALKQDEFIKWNSEQDKKDAEFAKSLGVLAELDKPDPTPPPVKAPAKSSQGGITLSGSVSEYSAVFSWKVSGVDTSKGFKLVKSKTSQTPTYPENSAAYIEAGKSSYNLYVGDGKTYYYRICAYRGDSCDTYSNTVTVTTPVKEVEKPVSGAVTLSLNGNVASWTFAGTSPHGFKLVISDSPNTPAYGNAKKTMYTGSPHTIDYLDPGTYNIRVCKYTASDYEGGCMDYSNQVVLIVP